VASFLLWSELVTHSLLYGSQIAVIGGSVEAEFLEVTRVMLWSFLLRYPAKTGFRCKSWRVLELEDTLWQAGILAKKRTLVIRHFHMTYLPLQLDDQVYFSTTWPRLARRREVGEGKMERRLVRFHSAGTSRPNLEASLNHGGFFSVRNGPEGITQCCRHGCEDGPIFLPLK